MITRLTHLFRLTLLLSAPLVCHSAHAQSANNVYSQVKRSVGIVIVSTFEGELVASGSAVTVASQTMVTNHHVLIPGHHYQVYMPGMGLYEAYQTTCDSSQDLCLMEVKNLNAAPVEFGDANKLSVGDTVYTIGAPNEIGNIIGVSRATNQKSYSPLQLTLGNGLITALRPVDDGNIIQTNAAMSPGSSGGGLFDAQGRLIGITTFMMRSGQSLNMALPVNWVQRLGVSGATRAPDSGMQAPSETFAPRAPTVSAPASTQASEPQTTEITPAQQPSAPVAVKNSWTHYWWAGIPLALILLYLLRRRNSEDDIDSYEIQPPTQVNPQLQRFLEEAQQELDQNREDKDLWSLVFADNKGNVQAASKSYVERRAARLLSAEKDKQWAAAARQSQAT